MYKALLLNQYHSSYGRYDKDDGLLYVAEFSFSGLQIKDDEASKISLGTWGYSKEIDHIAGGTKSKNKGSYILLDQAFSERTSGFLRYGVANPDLNDIANCLTLGMNLRSPFTARADDVFGIAYVKADLTDTKQRVSRLAGEPLTKSEQVIEASYRTSFGNGIAVQPDIQFIQDPGMNPNLKNAVVAAVRTELEF